MPDLTRIDGALHFELAGAGDPLFLIPGLFSDSASWAPLLPLLTGRRLVLPDPRGSGRTTLPIRSFTPELIAKDVLALADHLGIGTFSVIGHSFGGRVAQVLATEAPERVSHAGAIATAPGPSARNAALFAAIADTRARDPQGDAWLRHLFPWLFGDAFFADPDGIAAAIGAARAYPYAQTLAAMHAQIAGYAALGPAPRCRAPFPVLLAEGDALVPTAQAAREWEELGATVTIAPGAGHAAHWDAPQAVADWIAKRATG